MLGMPALSVGYLLRVIQVITVYRTLCVECIFQTDTHIYNYTCIYIYSYIYVSSVQRSHYSTDYVPSTPGTEVGVCVGSCELHRDR